MKRPVLIVLIHLILSGLIAPASLFAERRMIVMVQPFENTGPVKYSWVAAGMTNTVIADLNRVKGIDVITDSDRRAVIKEIAVSGSGVTRDDQSKEIGKLLSADVILTGSYAIFEGQVRIFARLVTVETGKVKKAAKIDGAIKNLYSLQDNIVHFLLKETKKVHIPERKKVEVTEDERKAIDEKWKPAPEAYKFYSKGLEAKYKNPRQSLEYFKRALKISPLYPDALREAGWVAGNSLDKFDDALKYLGKAVEILLDREAQNSREYAVTLKNIGLVYTAKGQNDKALDYYNQARNLEEKLGLKRSRNYAAIINNIGLVYTAKGDFDKALEYYNRSLRIWRALGLKNTWAHAITLKNIGIVYENKGQSNKALKNYNHALKIEKKLGLGKTGSYANTLSDIGDAYKQMGKFNTALKHYTRSQKIRDSLKLQNTGRYIYTLNSIAYVYEKKGRLDRALVFYNKALKIQENLGRKNSAAYAYTLRDIGICYEKKGKEKLAGKYFRRAYQTFKRIKYPAGAWERLDEQARKYGH